MQTAPQRTSKSYAFIFAIAALLLLIGLVFTPVPTAISALGFAAEIRSPDEVDGVSTAGPAATSALKTDPPPPSLFRDEIPNR